MQKNLNQSNPQGTSTNQVNKTSRQNLKPPQNQNLGNQNLPNANTSNSSSKSTLLIVVIVSLTFLIGTVVALYALTDFDLNNTIASIINKDSNEQDTNSNNQPNDTDTNSEPGNQTPHSNNNNSENTSFPDHTTLTFQRASYTIKLLGQDDPDTTGIFDLSIENTNYNSVKDLVKSATEDYSDNWGECLFYLPSNDQYYIINPSGHSSFRIISDQELQMEYSKNSIQEKPDGSTVEKKCDLKPQVWNGLNIKELQCESIYTYTDEQNPESNYTTTATNTRWLYEVESNKYLMYEIGAAPAGSDINASEQTLIEDIQAIEVL
jgi:hypothetical protein